MLNSWEYEYIQLLQDIASVGGDVLSKRGLSNPGSTQSVLKSIVAQREIESAICYQSESVKRRLNALATAFVDHNLILTECMNSMLLTLSSIESAYAWVEVIGREPLLLPLYSDYFERRALIDRSFGDRNKGGVNEVVKKISMLFVVREEAAKKSFENAEACVKEMGDGLTSRDDMILCISKIFTERHRSSVLSSDNIAGLPRSIAEPVEHSRPDRSINHSGTLHGQSELGEHYWREINKAFSTGCTAQLEQEILVKGNINAPICGKDANGLLTKNMMDHALGSAIAILKTMPNSRDLIRNVANVIAVLECNGGKSLAGVDVDEVKSQLDVKMMDHLKMKAY